MRFPAMIKPSPRRSTPFIINQTKRGISSRDASFLVCKVPTGTNCAQIVRPLNVRPNALFYFVRYDRKNSGASRGIRTLDTWFRRPVLYPLSYRRLTSVIIAYGKKIRKGKKMSRFCPTGGYEADPALLQYRILQNYFSTNTLGMRFRSHMISCGMVSAVADTSSTVISSSPCLPMRTTSSPGRTSSSQATMN